MKDVLAGQELTTLTSITKIDQNKYKSEEEDSIDYDGGGNWGRIPPKKK